MASNEDQTTITWFDPNYPHALNQFSILHYFELSPFFDSSCNNTIARQQGHDPAVPGALEFVVPQGGVEYVLELAQIPHLFLIRKQMRKGPDAGAPGALSVLAYYYVLDKVVYQAPTLHAVLSSRIRRCAWSLHQGFDKLQADLDPLKAQLRKREKLLLEEERLKQQQQQHQQQQSKEFEERQQMDQGLKVRGQGLGLATGAGQTAVDDEGTPQRELGTADAAPMPTVQRVNASNAAQWRRTDNIIMAVLSRYEMPEMPASYYGVPETEAKPRADAQGELAAPPHHEVASGMQQPGVGGVPSQSAPLQVTMQQQDLQQPVAAQLKKPTAAQPPHVHRYQPVRIKSELMSAGSHDVLRSYAESCGEGWQNHGFLFPGAIPKKKRTRSGVMR